jgi:hypothetical protein
MSHDTANLLNRIGIVLGYFSFWFAAPEFIGKERLKKWEEGLARLTLAVPLVSICSVIIFTSLAGGIFGAKIVNIPTWHGLVAIISYIAMFTVAMICVKFYGSKIDPHIEKLALRIVTSLVNDSRRRQNCLLFGAALFTISTVLQFLATYEK